MLFYIALGVLTLIGITLVARKPLRRRRVARRKAAQNRRIGREIDELLTKADEGDLEAQRQLVEREYWSSDPVRKRRLAANARRIRAEARRRSVLSDWVNYGERAVAAWQASLDAQREDSEDNQHILLFAKFLSYYRKVRYDQNIRRVMEQTGLRRREAKRRLREMVQERYDFLVATMHADSSAFWELRELILESNQFGSGMSRRAYPDGWNDAVARYFETPPIDEFVDVSWDVGGELRGWAAEALRDDDFTLARIVLAHCDSGRWDLRKSARAELGSVLIADLAKLVARHFAEFEAERAAAVVSNP